MFGKSTNFQVINVFKGVQVFLIMKHLLFLTSIEQEGLISKWTLTYQQF